MITVVLISIFYFHSKYLELFIVVSNINFKICFLKRNIFIIPHFMHTISVSYDPLLIIKVINHNNMI